MRIIIDTNILVSAILKGKVARAIIEFMVDYDEAEWIVSEVILAEYKEVINLPKFKLTEEVIKEWWDVLETVPRVIKVDIMIDFPRDKKDAKFLACALAAKADF